MPDQEKKSAPKGPRKFQKGGPKQGRPAGRHSQQNKSGDRRQDRSADDDNKEERKSAFVPWLGEARPKRGNIYDLEDKIGTQITIEFLSGRVIEGKLASFDRYMNIVLDDTVELLDEGKTRKLGTVFTCGRVETLGPTPVAAASS